MTKHTDGAWGSMIQPAAAFESASARRSVGAAQLDASSAADPGHASRPRRKSAWISWPRTRLRAVFESTDGLDSARGGLHTSTFAPVCAGGPTMFWPGSLPSSSGHGRFPCSRWSGTSGCSCSSTPPGLFRASFPFDFLGIVRGAGCRPGIGVDCPVEGAFARAVHQSTSPPLLMALDACEHPMPGPWHGLGSGGRGTHGIRSPADRRRIECGVATLLEGVAAGLSWDAGALRSTGRRS